MSTVLVDVRVVGGGSFKAFVMLQTNLKSPFVSKEPHGLRVGSAECINGIWTQISCIIVNSDDGIRRVSHVLNYDPEEVIKLKEFL